MKWPGKVIELSQAADPATGTYGVLVALQTNAHEGINLLSSMQGRARMEPVSFGGTRSYVPIEAVVEADNKAAWLFTVQTNNTVKRQAVQWDYENQEVMARLNGQRAVFITANQKDERNIFVTQKALQETADEFEKTLPPSIKLERGFGQYKNVEKRIDRLTFDFGLAVTLVLITLLPLGLRASGIVMVSVPLSLLTGLDCLYYAGFSLNQLSIAGLVVALGLLVDDSIVVIENISRYLRMGYNRVDAARLATKQISLAVVGCTATLLFVATLELDDNLNSIYRFDRERVVLLTAYTRTGYNTEKISNEIANEIDNMGLPTGYRYAMAGELKSRQQSFAGFGTAILITVFGILVFEFGSFRSTLIGIEIKNSILLVDFTNQLREEGKGRLAILAHGVGHYWWTGYASAV